MALRCRGSIIIYPRTGLQNFKMSRLKTQMAINISTVHLLHSKKKRENGCLYCIKIHATAWHSLVIKTREGEPARDGGRKSHERQKAKTEDEPE
jgi:hypothetical protein